MLGGGLLALALLAVWVQASGDSTAAHGPDGPTAQARVEQAEPAPGGMVGGGELPVMPIDAAQLEAQQSSAMARLTSDARMEAGRSVDVTGRPDYVSEVEWAMLKGVAAQHGHPEAELSRLVQLLHFNKQLERWEALGTGGASPVRRDLANWLLGEMPERVRRGELSLAEAQGKVRGLVPDAEPAGPARSDRLTQEWARLQAAASAKPRG